jgi:diguanylate cyclase (GGDEF)-like protein
VSLLASAFASVARHSRTRVSGIWLTGWLLIGLHFVALLFTPEPGMRGMVATLIALNALAWAGVLFMWASIPYRQEPSSRGMLLTLLTIPVMYLGALVFSAPAWALEAAAALMGIGPLLVAVTAMRKFRHPLRWITVALYVALAAFLLFIQNRGANGPDLALDAVLFTVYFDCCIHFWFAYRRPTTGAFITIYGFFTWSCVFVAAPFQDAYFASVRIESEVWNLPKYVVAVGMILLLLEDQIEHTKHLALHDVLTGLPNRRLFQDRLAIALERARRSGNRAALLILDLDRFKHVNDTMGHHAGDLLLQRVANIFSSRMRRSDTVARTGGDEFSVILEGPTSDTEAAHVGRSLQDLLKEPLQLENRTVRIGVSFGFALFPEDAADMESLCIVADTRMYENKRESADPDEYHMTKGKLSAVSDTAARKKARIEMQG